MSLPPVGNTGGKVTGELKVDWLNLVFPASNREAVLDLVRPMLGDCEDKPTGMHYYSRSAGWEVGAVLAWTPGGEHFLLSLNGDSMNFFPLPVLFAFCNAACALRGKCTRLDIAYDDFARRVPMDTIRQAAEAGNFNHFRVWSDQKETKRGKGITGDSLTFGRKGKEGSGLQVFIYDKALESKGTINSIRFEARYFKEKADLIFDCLISSFTIEAFECKLKNYVGGSIDFVERGIHRHKDRMPRLSWWQQIVDDLGQARVVVRKVIPPLEETVMNWIKPAVMPILALVAEIIDAGGHDGEGIVIAMMRQAKRKIANKRCGARDLGLDVGRILSAGPARTPSV